MSMTLRVIDLITELQNHDPVAPIQVWLVRDSERISPDSPPSRFETIPIHSVFQANPLISRAYGMEVDVKKERTSMPVVIEVG